MLLISLWNQIREVSDCVSIKHIHCPAINVLIAGETENVPGSFNNGVLFSRGHSDVEVGKPFFVLQTLITQVIYWNTWTVSVSFKFCFRENKNVEKKVAYTGPSVNMVIKCKTISHCEKEIFHWREQGVQEKQTCNTSCKMNKWRGEKEKEMDQHVYI